MPKELIPISIIILITLIFGGMAMVDKEMTLKSLNRWKKITVSALFAAIVVGAWIWFER